MLTPVARIADPAVLKAIMAKRTEGLRIAMMPFEASGGDDEEKTPAVANEKF